MIRVLTRKMICDFKQCMILEEKSNNTIEKYTRDIGKFVSFAEKINTKFTGEERLDFGINITKEIVIDYKKNISETYKARSVNSMLASINSLFTFLRWNELKIKTIKLQRQIFCPEEKEITRSEYERLSIITTAPVMPSDTTLRRIIASVITKVSWKRKIRLRIGC